MQIARASGTLGSRDPCFISTAGIIKFQQFVKYPAVGTLKVVKWSKSWNISEFMFYGWSLPFIRQMSIAISGKTYIKILPCLRRDILIKQKRVKQVASLLLTVATLLCFVTLSLCIIKLPVKTTPVKVLSNVAHADVISYTGAFGVTITVKWRTLYLGTASPILPGRTWGRLLVACQHTFLQ